jgi:hypothetical protein
MKVGYAYWGFLGDKKLDSNHNPVSTPDGNAFYSWAIIWDLINNGHEVVKLMPDRDKPAFIDNGSKLFKSFATEKREKAYLCSKSIDYPDDMVDATQEDLFAIWDSAGVDSCDVILLEWRMNIPGRNDFTSKENKVAGWQPDLFIQMCLVSYCMKTKTKLVVFDLDYKLSYFQALKMSEKIPGFKVLELGNKWENEHPNVPSETVFIPFDFTEIYTFKPKVRVSDKLVYVGNRYERDWCIDKYIPKDESGVAVYGNWLEGGRDSASRWPGIDFRPRITADKMHEVYSNSACTILLAKESYCKYHFMTARLLEAIFYGSVPLFIEDYGDDYIKYLVGSHAYSLIVRSEADVIQKINSFYENAGGRVGVLNSIRELLRSKFDVTNFTAALLGTPKPEWKEEVTPFEAWVGASFGKQRGFTGNSRNNKK